MTSTQLALLPTSASPRLIFDETLGVYKAIEPGKSGADAITVGVSGLTAAGRLVPFIIFAGESNSVGVAPNSAAGSAELDPRPSVKILNATSLAFESLQIGTNNSRRWYDFTSNNWINSAVDHGFENALATSVENGEWQDSQIYMMKTGQGGSNMSMWAVGHSLGFWAEFITRWNAATTAFASANVQPLPVVWYSQGINDLGAGTTPSVWKAATIAHFAKMRALIGFAPIIMTKFGLDVYPGHAAEVAAYNTVIDELAAEIPLVFAISTIEASKLDAAHWDYAGMKTVANKLISVTLGTIGERYRYLVNILKYAGSLEDPASSTPPIIVELVENGSFENGTFGTSPAWNLTPPNWTISTTSGNFAYPSSVAEGVTTPDGIEGKVFIFNGANTAPNCVIYQDITTVIGLNYRLEYWVRNAGTGQALNAQVLAGSTEIGARAESAAVGGTAWKKGFVNFTATTTTTRIKFTDVSSTTTGADTYLDKVSCFLR